MDRPSSYFKKASRVRTDDVPAAAFLAGAVLEKALRSPVRPADSSTSPVVFADGKPKMLNALIHDLKKAGTTRPRRRTPSRMVGIETMRPTVSSISSIGTRYKR